MNNRRTIRLWALAIGVLAWCLLPPAGHAETVDRVVAVVNGDAITRSDLDQAMASRLMQIVRSPNRRAAFHSVRREMLEHLIDERLLNQAMQRAKVEVEPDEVDRGVAAFLQQRRMSRPQLEQALGQQGIPFAAFAKRVEDELRQMKFVQQEVGKRVRISEQEMEDYYRRHMGEFKTRGRVRVGQIVLAFTPAMDAAARAALHRRAVEVAKESRVGNFAALAKAHSDGPNAAEGGDLGVIEPSTLHPQVAQALARMSVGEVSDPVPSKVGYHIIKLIDRGAPADSDYERLKDQIQQILYQQKMQAAIEQYVRQLRQRAYVEIKE